MGRIKVCCAGKHCNNDIYEGEKCFVISGKYFCTDCVDEIYLEADEPDWDSMPGGYDDWRE